jgi:outer membrane lipoprotein-sorting protein
MKSYQHTATFRASGTAQGKKVDQSAKFSMAMVRPNKFAFKMVSNTAVAVVSDGKQVTDFRAGEYSQTPAPALLKDLKLDQDDFDPVAGSFLIAHLLEDTVYTDRSLLGILIKSSGHKGLAAGSKTYDVIDFPIVGITFILYFDPATHLLERAAAKVPDQDLTLTETFDAVEIDKPVPDSAFTFALPKSAKKVAKPTR